MAATRFCLVHSGQRQSTTVTIEPRKTAEVDIEHVQAAALTGRQSDKRTAMRPPEFPNCRWIGGRVLEAMRGRGFFIGQARKHREDFAFKQNGLHGKSRVQRGLRREFHDRQFHIEIAGAVVHETFAFWDYFDNHPASLRCSGSNNFRNDFARMSRLQTFCISLTDIGASVRASDRLGGLSGGVYRSNQVERGPRHAATPLFCPIARSSVAAIQSAGGRRESSACQPALDVSMD